MKFFDLVMIFLLKNIFVRFELMSLALRFLVNYVSNYEVCENKTITKK